MKKWVLALALVAAPLFAQQSAFNPEERIQKLVQVKYVDPQSIRVLLINFGVDIQIDPKLKVVSLAGPRNKVTTAEEAIKQLDVPAAAQKDIELTVFFVVAGDQPNANASIPPDLQSTVGTLKTTFPFKTYTLLDSLSLRTRSGVGAETTGQLSGNRFTTFRVRSASLEADGQMIRLDGLHAGLRIPHNTYVNANALERKTEYIDTGITTDVVDVKEGQKLVIGRSSLDSNEKALFLILIAKIVQ
jgi:hypothetical protein